MDVVGDYSVRFNVGQGQVVVVGGVDGDEHSARETGDAAGFVFDDVGAVVGED